MKEKMLRMYDNDTVKWAHDGKLYCLHVHQDDGYGESPRDWDNLDTMACWHRRYNLGDEIADNEPEDFWQRLVRENVTEEEIIQAALAGELYGIRLAKNEDDPECYDIYETCYLAGWQSSREAKEYLEYSEVELPAIADYLIEDLTIGHCQKLLEPYAEWMDLWLYDHSGITMSCSRSGNPYSCPWDSGQVGWIIAFRDKIMKETREYILDENGEKIRVEYKHENAPSTWGYKTRPLTEETWRARAIEIMEADVDLYDKYLTGDVYGYTLYEAEPDGEAEDDPDWEEADTCWGFYGSDLFESGMIDYAPGLAHAVETGLYKEGEAVKHVSSYYTF